MNHKPSIRILLTGLTAWLFNGPVMAEEHASQAINHAQEAVDSAGDSKAVGQHAAEALKHIDAAKAAAANNPRAVKQLEEGEADLKGAVENANSYHGVTAVQDAKDAKTHLEDSRR